MNYYGILVNSPIYKKEKYIVYDVCNCKDSKNKYCSNCGKLLIKEEEKCVLMPNIIEDILSTGYHDLLFVDDKYKWGIAYNFRERRQDVDKFVIQVDVSAFSKNNSYPDPEIAKWTYIKKLMNDLKNKGFDCVYSHIWVDD